MPKRSKKLRIADVVVAVQPFKGRATPPEPLTGSLSGTPAFHDIPVGAQGLFHGKAQGAPDLHDVEFDIGGAYLRVEVPQGLVQHA